jgi:formylglycine-generating enzyme required for sulfatase activity
MKVSGNRRLAIFIIAWSFCTMFSQTNAQSIQDIIIEQVRDTIRINYDLISIRNDDIFEVNLTVSDNNGETFDIIPQSINGDIGFGIKPMGNLQIDWTPLDDSLELIGDDFVFKMNGALLGASKEIDFVNIPGGSFLMGSNEDFAKTDERKLHEVHINDFEMSVHEVTNYQYLFFLNSYGSDVVLKGEFKGKPLIYPNPKGLMKHDKVKQRGGSNLWITNPGFEYFPAVGVTWYGANEYCRYFGYRLPTEAEWEYAARECGENVLFGTGKNIADPSEINFDGKSTEKRSYSKSGESRGSQVRVAKFNPNKLRLFDMSGNVWEWCQDWYESNYYYHSKKNNPTGPWFGNYKTIRGGSWFNNAEDIRVTDRSFYSPYEANSDIGFRAVRSLLSD